VHHVALLPVFQVFLIPRVYPAYPPSAKRRHSRLGWLWVRSDEKDDVEMVWWGMRVPKKNKNTKKKWKMKMGLWDE
jgi:hypothetical protein